MRAYLVASETDVAMTSVAVVVVLARSTMLTRLTHTLGHIQLAGGATEAEGAAAELPADGVEAGSVVQARVAAATVDGHVAVRADVSVRALTAVPCGVEEKLYKNTTLWYAHTCI